MKKARFLLPAAMLFALTSCNLAFSTSSGSSRGSGSSTGDSSSQSSSVSQTPSIIVGSDGRLHYDADKNEYKLYLVCAERYELPVSLGDYHGDEFYIEVEKASDSAWLSVSDLTVIIADDVSYTSANAYLRVRLKNSDGRSIQSVLINVQLRSGSRGEGLVLEDTDGVTKTSEYEYRLEAKINVVYSLCPRFQESHYPDATIAFELDQGETFFTLSSTGDVQLKEDSSIGDEGYVYVRGYVGDKLIGELRVLVIHVTSYPEAVASIVTYDERVIVTRVDHFYYGTYEISVPYSGNAYVLPTLELFGYEGDFNVRVVSLNENALVISKIEDDYYATLAYFLSPEMRERFEYIAETPEGEIITTLPCCVYSRGIGEGEFRLRYGDENVEIHDGDTIKMQCYLDTPLKLTYNGQPRSSYSCGTLVNSSVGALRYDYFTAWKIGTSEVTFMTTETDALGAERTYTITFTLNVVDESIITGLELVGGIDSVSLVDGRVFLSDDLLVHYDIGRTVIADVTKGVTFLVSDGSTEETKTVTITYSERGQTVSLEYEVIPSSSSSLPKRHITRTYDDGQSELSAVRYTPHEGDIRCLVLPIWFKDSSDFLSEDMKDTSANNHKQQVIQDTEWAVFGRGKRQPDMESVASFYDKESHGTFHLTGEVAPWYECGIDSKDFEASSNGKTATPAADLTKAAVNAYFEDPEHKLSDFDGNGDGVIDSIITLYGVNAYGATYYSRAFNLGYTGPINSPNYFANFSFVSALDIYNLAGKDPTEQLATGDLSSFVNDQFDTATLIHEYGHSFGFSDLYDEYGKDESGKRYYPAGGFSRQDGSYGAHDPYHCLTNGWADPFVLDASSYEAGETTTFTLNDFQSSADVALLTPSFSTTKQGFDEYLLLELYTPTGLNRYDAERLGGLGAKKTGIRLWHAHGDVNERNRHVYDNHTKAGDEIDFDLLHLIRSDASTTYKTTSHGFDETLFVAGDTFDMETYAPQFRYGNGKLDSGLELGWKIQIDDIAIGAQGSAIATITLTRA